MFSIIVSQRESNLQIVRFLIVLIVVEIASTLEMVLLRWPACILFYLTQCRVLRPILPLWVSSLLLLPYGRFVRLSPDDPSSLIFAHRVWNWPELLRRVCWFLLRLSSSSDPSAPLYCYLAQGIVFARAKRFQRPEIIQGRVQQNAFADCAVQDVAEPTAINSPVVFSVLCVLFYKFILRRRAVGSESECLQLCAWLPARFVERQSSTTPSPSASYYVFCHGGAFCFGSNQQSMHDCRGWWSGGEHKRLHQQDDSDEIVLHLQYRLGIHGCTFFAGIEANLCLHDVLCGLKWVNNNKIQGGKICLIGQSAGAMMCSVLAQHPAAAGLFDTVFLMSSPTLHIHGPKERDACRAMIEDKIREVLPLSTGSLKSMLLEASCDQLLEIQSRYCAHVDGLYRNFKLETRFIPMNLSVDEESSLLPIHPQLSLRAAASSSSKNNNNSVKRFLFSNTAAEYVLFFVKHFRERHNFDDPETQLQLVERRIRQYISASVAESFLEIGHDVPASPLLVAGSSSAVSSFEQIQSTANDLDDGKHQQLKRQFIKDRTAALLASYRSLWMSGRLDSRFLISTSNMNALSGKVWCSVCADWGLRMPTELFAQDVMMNAKKASSKTKVRLIRNDVPCDLIPAMSSPHTGDVPFLFGSLFSFPHLLLDGGFTCPRRHELALRLRNCVRLMHTGSDEEVEAAWPAERNDRCCAASGDDGEDSDEGSRPGAVWKIKRPVEWGVLRMKEGRGDETDTNDSSLLLVEPEEAEREAERVVLNREWEEVVRALMEFKS